MNIRKTNLLTENYEAPRAMNVELANEGFLLAGSEPKSYQNESVNLEGFDGESAPTVPDYIP